MFRGDIDSRETGESEKSKIKSLLENVETKVEGSVNELNINPNQEYYNTLVMEGLQEEYPYAFTAVENENNLPLIRTSLWKLVNYDHKWCQINRDPSGGLSEPMFYYNTKHQRDQMSLAYEIGENVREDLWSFYMVAFSYNGGLYFSPKGMSYCHNNSYMEDEPLSQIYRSGRAKFDSLKSLSKKELEMFGEVLSFINDFNKELEEKFGKEDDIKFSANFDGKMLVLEELWRAENRD